MDYLNIDEVADAIKKYDCNLGTAFCNLPTYISNASIPENQYYSAKYRLRNIALKAALTTLFILKQNECFVTEEKANDFFTNYSVIPFEETAKRTEAFNRYSDAVALANKLSQERNEIKQYARSIYIL